MITQEVVSCCHSVSNIVIAVMLITFQQITILEKERESRNLVAVFNFSLKLYRVVSRDNFACDHRQVTGFGMLTDQLIATTVKIVLQLHFEFANEISDVIFKCL